MVGDDLDDNWGEESYRGPDLKIEENGVFMINEAIMSYSVMSGSNRFYFSLETKALNQTFNLYNKVYFGKQYEEAAREELKNLGVSSPTTGKLAKQIHKIFRPQLQALCTQIIDDQKQPEVWIPSLKAAVKENFSK